MRYPFLKSKILVAPTTMLVSLLLAGSLALAQRPAKSDAPFDPHDLSGVWGGQSTGNRERTLTKEEPPMNAAGLAFYHAQKTEFSNPPVDGVDNTDPILRCEPGSIPRTYGLTHPIEIVQTPKEILMLLETYRNFRIIYMDGRKMPDHPEGTWYGDSIGHWDGNTLVIETTNFNGRSWLDQVGHPTSDKLHLTERLTRTDHDHMKMDITVDDPTYYTKPWGGTITWQLRPPGWDIEDYLCSPADESFMNKVVRYPADPVDSKKK
jgi:hypothetical protein